MYRMDAEIRSPFLVERLKLQPPPLLYHYSGPEAVIGILKNKEIWATNTSFLNDFNELYEASNTAKNVIENMLRRGGIDKGESDILEKMHNSAGSAAKRYYVCSFTEVGDSLSQWRAYCPVSGGYAIGFPSAHLLDLAKETGWMLVKCVYDHAEKYRIVTEVVNSYLSEYRKESASGSIEEDKAKDIVWRFYQHVAQIGGAIKHRSFSEENEWRLISPNIPEQNNRIEFRPGVSSVVPYYRFPLETEQNSNLAKHGEQTLVLRCGPTPHRHEAAQAAQFILTRYLGGAGHGNSEIPFKGW